MMIRKLNERVAKALVGLDRSHDWTVVEDWLEEELGYLRDQLCEAENDACMRQYQGAVRFLRDFLKKKTQARDILNKL